MTRFIAFTTFHRPGLHIWSEGTARRYYMEPLQQPGLAAGSFAFDCELGVAPLEKVYCLLFNWDQEGTDQTEWEQSAHIHEVPRLQGNRLPATVWLFQGSARAVADDPFAQQRDRLRIHLVTANRYMQAELFVWSAPGFEPESRPLTSHDASGPFWDVDLTDRSRSFFQFKFRRPGETGWNYEPDYANRVWVAQDGSEIWTHSEARDVLSAMPIKRQFILHFHQDIAAVHPARMHLWQEGSDFETDVSGEVEAGDWTAYRVLLYTRLPYRCMFFNPTFPGSQWENDEAKRDILIHHDTEHWTLEGDSHLFSAEPKRNCRVNLTVAVQPPGYELSAPLSVEAWVNRARALLPASGTLSFITYPDVVTSFRVRGANGPERIDRHYVIAQPAQTIDRWLVLGRAPTPSAAPPAGQFSDPPFTIRRPGAYEEGGFIRFVLHAPFSAQVELRGAWMPDGTTHPMRSTNDGTYWWAQIPVSQVNGGNYHGVRYHYILNGDPAQRVQDPAAGWVEGSGPQHESRLLRRDQFQWNDQNWQTPSWNLLRLYQLHASRFSSRGPAGASALERVAWEIENTAGYLRQLRVNALQLMPINEVGTTNSWGYDPAFFYAVETSYGGPDALKALVDSCHRHGFAVFMDVVFNHAGTSDNSLWPLARGSFFDGDTAWGAMVNYDHPQVIHFFEQNLVYLLEEYHVDGFRFDFTRVIIRGHERGEAHVRHPGSGGGWEFLHKLRAAARNVKPDCILIAEHLPNEWAVTNFGGPMDSQWCDDFHDRLKDACSGNPWVISSLADAIKVTHTAADDWYKATIYAESHDEVGNENGRIAHVAGFGFGWRMAKVAAAVVLMGRGIPMFFMGAESGEHLQFFNGTHTALDLDRYLTGEGQGRIRAWYNALLDLRGSQNIKGPSPLAVVYAQDQQLAFVRGNGNEYYTLVNFGGWSGWKSLAELNLSDGVYRELWNSTWPAFAVEGEGEHTNGGRDARLHRGSWLQVPDYGVVILERI